MAYPGLVAGTWKDRDVTETNVADQFAEMARELRRGPHDVKQTLGKAVALARDVVAGCDEAAVSIVQRKGAIDTPAATSQIARRCDELQYELREGPCLDAIWDRETVSTAVLAGEVRWPQWRPKVAADFGVRSMLCLQLFVVDDSLGAMNLYSFTPGAFDDIARAEGLAMAAHVAVALASARELDQLTTATIHRTVIGQAQGILMERLLLTADEAFAVLTGVSSRTNRKLYDIATDLVRRRHFDQEPQTPGQDRSR